MKKKIYTFIVCSAALLLTVPVAAQVIRPYGLLFSDNIRGGCTMFGNTITHIVENGAVNTFKMNETGNAQNTSGGIGFSQYGNDNSNIQFADVDGTLPLTSPIFSFGSNWKYFDQGSRPVNWEIPVFDDAAWSSGPGELGFGDGDEVTLINGGPSNSRHMSTYFRKQINIVTTAFSDFTFLINYDDGAVVYINGTEAARFNMPPGALSNTTSALSAVDNATGSITLPPSAFVNGLNTIAVEVHQRSNKSDDLSFDLSLTGTNINTGNSSAADLVLPAGNNTIRFARLYWGGRVDNTLTAAAPDTLRKVKIRKGTSGFYSTVFTAAANTDTNPATAAATAYQSYVDITSFINNNGSGTYTVADIPASTGPMSNGGNYAAWCIVVAYENSSIQYNSIRIYDGFLNVFNGGAPTSQSVTLTGLNVPNNSLVLSDAIMTSMVWEGDANLAATPGNPAGDFLRINNNTYTNAVNPATNMWNGSISSNGSFVTSKNPDYTNQMGIDIDEIQVGTGYGILPNASAVTIEFGTEADRYYPSLFSFCIRMKPPAILLDKTVSDANGNGVVEANEVLTYTISGISNGPGDAYNCTITDTLPASIAYVPGSMELINCPGLTPGPLSDAADTDIGQRGSNNGRDFLKFFLGTGATGTAGGQLSVGQAYTLRFKVQAGSIPGSVSNTARITANSQAGEAFVDDGTALIGPAGGAIPVTLAAFSAAWQGRSGLLNWTTSQELNNSHFEVERSTDGIRFSNRGKVEGHGTSQLTHHYQFMDPVETGVPLYYYRLKIKDLDGKAAYSKTVALRRNKTVPGIQVYPNPFTDHVKITLYSATETITSFVCMSADGKQQFTRQVLVQKGDNVVILAGLETLPRGNYLLRVNGEVIPLIKQ